MTTLSLTGNTCQRASEGVPSLFPRPSYSFRQAPLRGVTTTGRCVSGR